MPGAAVVCTFARLFATAPIYHAGFTGGVLTSLILIANDLDEALSRNDPRYHAQRAAGRAQSEVHPGRASITASGRDLGSPVVPRGSRGTVRRLRLAHRKSRRLDAM